MITQTSLEAWNNIQDTLGDEQLKVLEIFRTYPAHMFTDEELSIRLSKPINCITPRRGELECAGYIYRCGKVKVTRNGITRSVFTWKLKEY